MTLLESLIAFIILVLVSVSVVAVSSQSTVDTAVLEKHYYAGLVADNVLQQTQLTHAVLEGALSGRSQQMGYQWHWTVQPVATEQGALQQWTIRVFIDNKMPEKSSPLIQRISYVATSKE